METATDTSAPQRPQMQCIYCGLEFDPIWAEVHRESCEVVNTRRQRIVDRMKARDQELLQAVQKIQDSGPTPLQLARSLRQFNLSREGRRDIMTRYRDHGLETAMAYLRGHLGLY